MAGRKSFHRSDRVAAQLRRDVGTLVHNAMREYGLPSVSVSDVEVTRDLAHAKVFVTAFEKASALETLRALQQLSKELRKALAHMMKLRHVPELHFFYDESLDRGEHIETLLRQLPAAHIADADDEADEVDDSEH